MYGHRKQQQSIRPFLIKQANPLTSQAMQDPTQTELEAAAFRRLLQHLDSRKDVQNIDLMNLAGFCRNCLSKWYKAAADERNLPMSDEQAREKIYGMPYKEWKALYQVDAIREQLDAFEKNRPLD